jgi:hypothetical protein
MKKAGSLRGVVMQPRRRISYKSDGTIEGVVKYRSDGLNRQGVPRVGTSHPDEPKAVLHNVEIEFLENQLIETTCHYHGISLEIGDQSKPVIDYPGGVDQLPIQLHPDFAEFAGTPSDPKNGALWINAETGEQTTENEGAEFAGFFDPGNEFFGVEFYLVARPTVTRTYWTNRRPTLKKQMTIVNSIPGFTNPPGIKNWLLMDTPFRQVGDAYQVTEQYKGSPDPGWNRKIYK